MSLQSFPRFVCGLLFTKVVTRSFVQSLWPGDRPSYTAPVFRKHTKQDEGFIGGGRWKYNVKSSEMFVEGRVDEKSETVGDDATVACKDVAAGLIRTGILPRIRYILEVILLWVFPVILVWDTFKAAICALILNL